MVQELFNSPDENNGFKVFPDEFENDPNVLFHGTSEDCAELIKAEGFKSAKLIMDEGLKPAELIMDEGLIPNGPLPSISFARKSSGSIEKACLKRGNGQRAVVLAVKFKTLEGEGDGIRPESDFVYLDDHSIQSIQPEIVAINYISDDYKHT